jgi:16S rRNA (guanine966-N2)-methyltransferase
VLRIIAGSLRGRRLHTPAGLDTRPTADAMKETLYNVLGDAVRGARIADLYAGSGNLGLEALSRGAAHAVFVEQSPAALAVLRQNIAVLGVGSQAQVVSGDALRYLEMTLADRFDIVIADPPYTLGAEDRLLASAAAGTGGGGWLVLQHGKQWAAPDSAPGWSRLRPRRFGVTVIDFFLREERGDGGSDGAVPGDI